MLLHSMSNGILEAIKNEDSSTIPNLKYMEKTNNRYTGFLRRVLNREGYGNGSNEKVLYCLMEFLEKIADEFKYLCYYFMEDEKRIKKVPKKIISLFERLDKLIEGTYLLYYKYGKDQFKELYEERKLLVKESIELFSSKSGRDCMLAHYIVTITQEISDILAFIMTMNQ